MTELEVTNKQLMEKLSIFTGDTGIDIDDLEKALSIVKKGDVQGLATSGPARGLEQSSETTETLKREQAGLVQEVAKLTQMTKVQDAISEDLKSEIDAQKIKFGQLQREYDYKLQEANRTLAVRAERVRILETRLRNQIYALAHSNQQGSLRDSMTGKSLGGGGPQIDDDTESLMSDGAFDEDVEDGENIFEITIRELLLDESVKTESGIPPATFFAFDFFEFETQTTPVVSGTRQQLNYTSQFVVKVDAFFLNYLATKTMKLDLFQSCGGMEFKELATCQVPPTHTRACRGRSHASVTVLRARSDDLPQAAGHAGQLAADQQQHRPALRRDHCGHGEHLRGRWQELTADSHRRGHRHLPAAIPAVGLPGDSGREGAVGGALQPGFARQHGDDWWRRQRRPDRNPRALYHGAARPQQKSTITCQAERGNDNKSSLIGALGGQQVDSAADLKPRLPNTAPKPYVHYKLVSRHRVGPQGHRLVCHIYWPGRPPRSAPTALYRAAVPL